jgi:hypothetical protein
MLSYLSVAGPWHTVAKRFFVSCGCTVLSLAAIIGFGFLQKIQAAGNILPGRQVAARTVRPRQVRGRSRLQNGRGWLHRKRAVDGFAGAG